MQALFRIRHKFYVVPLTSRNRFCHVEICIVTITLHVYSFRLIVNIQTKSTHKTWLWTQTLRYRYFTCIGESACHVVQQRYHREPSFLRRLHRRCTAFDPNYQDKINRLEPSLVADEARDNSAIFGTFS